jgi:hypothetical protein
MDTDRRRLIGIGAAAAGVALTADRSQAQRPASQIPDLYPGWNGRQFRAFQRHENAHVEAITALIRQIGGTPRPRPTFKGIDAPDVRTFATLSRTFVNTGAGAYTATTPVIFDKDVVLPAAASIAIIEGRHGGYINHALNFVQTADVYGNEQQFEQPLTQEQVIALASPFIASLNGGPPPRFNLTPSRANDIAILNFALVLEYLEQDFYNLNVPKFFPA